MFFLSLHLVVNAKTIEIARRVFELIGLMSLCAVKDLQTYKTEVKFVLILALRF